MASAIAPRLRVILRWLVRAALIGTLGVLSSDLFALAWHKNFAIDEFAYAHAAYAIAQGQVPFRDFFDMHLPLNYQVLSAVFRLGASKPSAILYMRFVMLGWAALTLFGSWLLCRRFGVCKALLGPIFVLVCVPLWLHGHELRHDPIALALFVLALGLPEWRVDVRLSSALAGVATVLCFWSTQKAQMFAGVVLLPALALDLLHKRRGDEALLLVHPRAWLSGAGAMAGVIALWLVLTRNVGPLVRDAFIMGEYYQSHYPRVSLSEQLWPQLDDAAMLLPFALAGVWATVRSASNSAAAGEQRDGLLLAALGSTFLSYALSQAPFPYSAVPFWGILGVISARGVLALWSASSASAGRSCTLLASALLALCFVAARAHTLYRTRIAQSDNRYQLSVLDQVDQLTSPEDAFFDCSGKYVARPHSYRYIYIDALLRNDIPNLSEQASRAMLDAGAVAVMPDMRYGGLPAGLRSFIEAHYQRYSGDLWFYGQNFDAAAARSAVRFHAIKRARYFVNGAGGDLLIDGRAVAGNEFELERGDHQLTFARASGPVQVLWLPKNGEHWRPHPEERTTFTSVF